MAGGRGEAGLNARASELPDALIKQPQILWAPLDPGTESGRDVGRHWRWWGARLAPEGGRAGEQRAGGPTLNHSGCWPREAGVQLLHIYGRERPREQLKGAGQEGERLGKQVVAGTGFPQLNTGSPARATALSTSGHSPAWPKELGSKVLATYCTSEKQWLRGRTIAGSMLLHQPVEPRRADPGGE